MLYIHDKAKAIFESTINGQYRLKKAKIISIALEETSEKANTYFLESSQKTPTHFVLDDTNIVKYDYNTTNVFPAGTGWTESAKRIIEPVNLELPQEITGNVKILDKPLTTKTFEEKQTPTQIVLYFSENTADDFYMYLERRESDSAYHYIIDDQNCYRIVPPYFKCYTENQIHIAILGKNNLFDTFDRAAKLITQILEEFGLSQYMPIADKTHIHAMPEEHFASIEERIQIITKAGGTSDLAPTSIRKDDLNPGDHIISVKLLYPDPHSYERCEKLLIKFLAEYLFYFDLDTTSVWRITDLINKGDSALFYNKRSDFEHFLSCVNEGLKQLKQGVQQIEVSTTGLPEFDADGKLITHSFEKDDRDIALTTFYLTNNQKSVNQDYDSYTIGGNVELRSKFEDGAGAFSETLKISSNYYEPIYPDLTVPPRNATTLYNKGMMSPRDIIKEMEQPHKPVIGKTPNAFDPYPTDDKIAQLEMHAPIVTLEYESAGDVQSNLFGFVNNRFGNTEKRLVRLENILSTIMRYQARLASRIQVNCLYYGGTSPFDKYSSIRCMCDDLTNDADTRTLDQCLNCSRYEPILGQIYEITGDNPGMAQIYDDVQSSRMTKEEFAKFNNLTDHSEPFDKPEEDLTSLHLRAEGEKGYDELLDEADNFVMNWTETPYHQQSPHINDYHYNPYDIYRDKSKRLEKVYEDGWREQTQLKFQRPQYSMNSVGGGNFNPVTSEVDGLNGLYNIHDYDIKEDDVRLKIIQICERAVALGQEEKMLYTHGARIQDQYIQYTPDELVERVMRNETVNQFTSSRGDDDVSHKAVYFDTASFASYVYMHCDILRLVGFSVSSLENHYGFNVIKNNHTPLLQQITQAYPGDILLYKNHVSIYAGEDYQYEAKDDKLVKSADQICKSKIRDANDFIGIYRHKDLSTPVVKNRTNVLIKATLDDYIAIQVGKNVGRDTNGDGYIEYAQDKDWLKDKTVLRNYIDPKKRLTPELKMQFASIRNLKTPGIITEDTINDFLLRVGGKATKKIRGLKVDVNYNPVRDENNNLVWEEKYAFPRGDVWLAAANKSGLNPLFLLAHCAGETGWCVASNWTNYSGDYKAKNSDDYLFNAFGIWCYDSEYFPNQPALHRVTAKRKAEENKWFSLEKSIIEGAKWIADQYLGEEAVSKNGRRDTAYFMKWHMGNLIEGQNPKSNPGTMQYATDVSWADQRAKMLYNALKNSPVGREEAIKHFEYFIPEFIDNTIDSSQNSNTALKDLGEFTITYYCGCQKCNGKWYGSPAANGEALKANYTIAVDPDIIPLGTWVEIEGLGKRKACDTGSAIKGKKIDVYLDNHDECYRRGKHTAKVFLIE